MKNRETIVSNVKHILTNLPTARDNNNYLWFTYINLYSKIYGEDAIEQLYNAMEIKKVPSFETLARFSRQLQEKNPHLRGREWEKRQRKQVKFQSDLGYNVKN